MPNVNAIKKFTKKKIESSNLSNNIKKTALKNINRLNVKQKTEKFIAEQKLYNKLLKFNSNLANNIVFSPTTQRLLSVRPLPVSAKKSIKKSSPKTSGRTARRQTAKAGIKTLKRTVLPYNLIDRIMTPMFFRSALKSPLRR